MWFIGLTAGFLLKGGGRAGPAVGWRAPHPLASADVQRTPESATPNDAKYGFDPRENTDAKGAEGMSTDAFVPPAPGTVGDIASADQLQAAIDAEAARGGMVVLKYLRAGCAACKGCAAAS